MGAGTAQYTQSIGDRVYTLDSLGATAVDNISGTTDTKIYVVEIDCTSQTAADVYVRFYNLADPTVGTDDAVMVLKGYASSTTTYIWAKTPCDVFTTALSVACVTNAGGGGGADAPTGTVDVTIVARETT